MQEDSKGIARPAEAGLSEPIAIIGISALFPQAESLREYWSNIKRGVDSITEVPATHWNAPDYLDSDPKRQDHIYTSRGGFLPLVPFNPIEFGISPTQMEATDSSQLLGLLVAHGALVDAGYGPGGRAFPRERTSVILGVTGALELTVTMGARLGHPVWRDALAKAGVHPEVIEDVVRSIGDSYVAWQEDTFPGLLGNVVAGRISNRLDLGGTNCVVDAACASSLSAAHLAVLELASGRADMAITGGVDTFNDIFMYSCFAKTMALSKTGDARPFDASADGTILGEGVGMVVMKRLSDAERDGDVIYAVLKGIGSSSDGRGKAIYAPSAEGQERALREAYRQAGVTADTIELFEAHGTGTKVGDATEVSALTKIYREARSEGMWCALGSVKSQIGHTKAAAGVAGMIKVALALRHKVIPPTIKVSEPNAAVDLEHGPFYLPVKKRPWLSRGLHPRRAAVSALGFGGTNFHLVLEEHKTSKSEIDWDGRVQIVALSAETLEALREKLGEFADGDFDWKELSRRATRSRREFSSQHAYRLIQVLDRDKHAPRVVFQRLREQFDLRSEERFWSTPEGAYFGKGKRLGRLGFLFPGQGSQYVGMCLDLACVFPQMQDALTEANVVFTDLRDVARQLSDFIYPPQVFGLDADKLNELALRATNVAQPAIGAVSMGALCILTMFGVFPAAAAGHSYGELMALFAGGRIDAPTLLHLSKLRGELMAQGEGDRGSMIAVRASAEEAEQVIEEEGLDLTIANKNGPAQVVLSGRTEEVERAAKIFGGRKVGATKLPVAAAFHSPLVAQAQEPFSRALEGASIQAATADVYSNTTGGVYPQAAEQVRELLAGQLARPVEFVKQIEAMHAAGVQTFVEVGPGNKMSALVRAILGEREYAAFAVDRSSGRGSGVADLAETLAQIGALGHEIDLAAWEDGRVEGQAVSLDAAPATTPGMKIMINGANYRREKPDAPPKLGSNGKGKGSAMAFNAPTPAASYGKAQPAATLESGNRSASHERHQAPPPRTAPVSLTPRTPATPPPVADSGLPSSLRAPASSNPALAEALRSTQQSLLALQQLQQQTAELHQKFLEGQSQAQQALQQLIARQEGLFQYAVTGVAPPAGAAAPASFAAPAVRPIVAATALRTPAAHVEPVTPPPSLAPLPSTDSSAILLGIVSEKTGYPVEMLNLEMDMESDLGIDSIKRVEILSTLQESMPHLPTIEAEALSDIRTLNDIVAFMNSVPATPSGAQLMPAPRGDESIPAAPVANGAGLAEMLILVVAEKTGYPAEMLDLKMDMESDLGIDSIKRVEILSELQERLPEMQAPEAEEIGGLRTLADVVAFLAAGSAAPAVAHGAGGTNGTASHAPVSALRSQAKESRPGADLRALLLSVVSDKTGYPADMLNLEMDMESDLGIDSIKRVEILSELQERVPELPVIEPDDIGAIRRLQDVIDYLEMASAGAPSAPAKANGSYPHGAVNPASKGAVSHATATPIHRTVLAAAPMGRPEGDRAPVRLSAGAEIFLTGPGASLRTLLARKLIEAGHPAREIDAGELAALSQNERIGGLIYVADAQTPALGEPWRSNAERDVREAFEVVQAAAKGLRRSGRDGGAFLAAVTRMDGAFGLAESSADFDPIQGALAGLIKTARHEWPEVSCRVIDVAADRHEDESLAEAILNECATHGGAEVGLSSEGRNELREIETAPEAGPMGVGEALLEAGDVVVVSGGARGVTAETAVALARAYRPTLVLFGRTALPEGEPEWLRPLENESVIKKALLAQANGHQPTPREIQRQYEAIRASRELIGNLRRIEAAGSRVLYRSLDIRDAEAVERALDVIRAEAGPIRGIVHGAGVLADRLIEEKTAEQYDRVVSTKLGGLRALLAATRRDPLRMIALFSSSTARYGRTGQVDYAMANEALNKIAQREARLRPECRVVSFNWGPWAGGMVTPGLEKVFAAEGVGLIPLEAGGRFLVDELERPSRDVEVVAGVVAESNGNGSAPKAAANGESGKPAEASLRTAFTTRLDTDTLPVLESHVIDGRPVLPVALMLEWFAHAALHENPGLQFLGVDDLRVLRGVKLNGAPYDVQVRLSKPRRTDGGWSLDAELRGGPAGENLHARCAVALDTVRPAADGSPRRVTLTERYPRLAREAYRELLFHGPALQCIERIDGWGPGGIEGAVKTSPAPAEWMPDAPRSEWVTDPLAIDGALQLLILWTCEQHGQASLPTRIGRYRQFASGFGGALEVSISVASTHGSLVHANIDFASPDGHLLARIEDCEHVMDARLIESFTRVDPMADPIA